MEAGVVTPRLPFTETCLQNAVSNTGASTSAHLFLAGYTLGRYRKRGISLVLRRLRSMFGGGEPSTRGEPSPLYGLDPEERELIGTESDPLRRFEAGMARNAEAERAVHDGDPERAIDLYETSVAEEFVGSHPYERLASLYERRDPSQALKVCEAYLRLAASGKMPRGAQRSADRKRQEFEARAERYRRLLHKD